MSRGWLFLSLVLCVLSIARFGYSEQFDEIEAPQLAELTRTDDSQLRARLTFSEIEALPTVLRDNRSALVIATTGQGNYARMLLAPALRKAPESSEKPVPVLVLERFEVFDAGNKSSRVARGKDLILFSGFQLDLDTGLVVPNGQGGDVQFLVDGEGGPRLVPLGTAKLYTLKKPLAPAASSPTRPSLGRSVLPGDFNGRYQLFANGQWSGVLELKVGGDQSVTGRFRSDLNGTAYPVTGQVAAETPQKINFTVKYPRTAQEFEGLLWTEGKGAMAGSVTMIGRTYGFFAIREGSRFAPEGEDVAPLSRDAGKPHRKTVTVRKGQYTLDGQPRTDQELSDSLKKSVAAEPKTWVLLQVADDEPYSAVRQAFEVISAGGIESIRVGPLD